MKELKNFLAPLGIFIVGMLVLLFVIVFYCPCKRPPARLLLDWSGKDEFLHNAQLGHE